MVELLGLIGSIGLMFFYLPQLYSLIRAPRVEGFNLFAWSCLFVAVTALAAGAALAGWWTGMVANTFSAVCVAASIYCMRKKS